MNDDADNTFLASFDRRAKMLVLQSGILVAILWSAAALLGVRQVMLRFAAH